MEFDKAYFDAGIARLGTECEKWDGMIAEHGDADMIPMWVADMDFPSPPAIEQALAQVLARGTWGYTISGKADAEALCGYWARRHGVRIAPDEVLMSPCVVTGLRLCVRTMTQPGDGVLITTPVYGPFYASIRANGRRVVESPLVRDAHGRYGMNLPDMETKLSSGEAKAVMLCSPHNPCGRAWSAEELAAVVRLCRRYGAGLVCDEIHADFVFAPNRHHSILSIEGARDIAVMLCAASKTFNVAGLQQSAIVCANAQLRGAIEKEMDACGVRSGNAFALAATRAAYTACDAWLDGLLDYLADNRDFVVRYLGEHLPQVRVTPLEATYLMWLDCTALGMTQQALMETLLAHHLKVNDGLFFGEQGRGFVRLNIGCPRAQLEAALHALCAALGGAQNMKR